MSDENDPNNPLNSMFPQGGGNPKYDQLKREHEERIQNAAEQGVLTDPAFSAMSDRMQGVRKTNPLPQPPQPRENAAREENVQQNYSEENHTGIHVDPNQGRVNYTPPNPRLPEQPVQQETPVQQAPVKAVRSTQDSGINKVLSKLRQDFGIDTIPKVDVKLGESIFTLRLLDSESISSAVRFADMISLSERENVLKLQIACVSFAVQAIDGVPLWKIFDIPIPNEYKIRVEGRDTHTFAEMNPPTPMRMQAAASFMDFLGEETVPSLADELWRAYGEKVDSQGSLSATLERIGGGSQEEDEEENLPLP